MALRQAFQRLPARPGFSRASSSYFSLSLSFWFCWFFLRHVHIQCPFSSVLSAAPLRLHYTTVPHRTVALPPCRERCISHKFPASTPFLFQGCRADRRSADLQLGRPCPGAFLANQRRRWMLKRLHVHVDFGPRVGTLFCSPSSARALWWALQLTRFREIGIGSFCACRPQQSRPLPLLTRP